MTYGHTNSRGPGASGWRKGNNKSEFWDVLQHQCEEYGLNDTARCIEEATYNFTDIIIDSWLENPIRPTGNRPNLRNRIFWTADFTQTWPGMCFTLNIEESDGNNEIHLFFNVNLTFIVFVHDPNFFIYSNNPEAIPMTTLIVPKKKTFQLISFVETEHEELNVPADPCEEDIEYSFTACVKKMLARQVGCRTKWDKWTKETFPYCHTLEQFR